MIRYQIRPKPLLDLVNEIRSGRLIMSPYFQRNLVWRDVHKVEFIRTILMGYPFPQIFIAQGDLDVDKMIASSCIVDGQQRVNAIMNFVDDKMSVDGLIYSELDTVRKEEFLNYEISVVDLKLTNDSPDVVELFKRLNRTFYSLSTVERLSTEYAPSELMLLAKFAIDEIETIDDDGQTYMPTHQFDPNTPKSFVDWMETKKVSYFNKLILNGDVFSPFELTRQVPLMFVLNLICTYIKGFYNRNDQVVPSLEEFKENLSERDALLARLEASAKFILALKLKDKSIWLNKANLFSLLCLAMKHHDKLEPVSKFRFSDLVNAQCLAQK